MTKRFCIAIVAVLVILFLVSYLPVHGEEAVYDTVVRLHVLANSDSEEDQALKLRVRDAVLAVTTPLVPKYKTRDLPGLKTYLERKGELPKGLVLGLAAIMTYYKGGMRGDVEIIPNDDAAIVALLKDLWASEDVRKVAEGVLGAEFIWGEDLNAIPGLTDMVTGYLGLIQDKGMRAAVATV